LSCLVTAGLPTSVFRGQPAERNVSTVCRQTGKLSELETTAAG